MKLPPRAKVYEALGAVADGRVEETGGVWRVTSSDGSKRYTVRYDGQTVSSDDNATYWQGYAGYPVVAVLMVKGVVSHDPEVAALLQGVAWKRINQKHTNDYGKALAEIREAYSDEAWRRIEAEVDGVSKRLASLDLTLQRPNRAAGG